MTFQDAATAKGLFLNLVALCCKWNVSYQQRQRMDVVMSVHETGPPCDHCKLALSLSSPM